MGYSPEQLLSLPEVAGGRTTARSASASPHVGHATPLTSKTRHNSTLHGVQRELALPGFVNRGATPGGGDEPLVVEAGLQEHVEHELEEGLHAYRHQHGRCPSPCVSSTLSSSITGPEGHRRLIEQATSGGAAPSSTRRETSAAASRLNRLRHSVMAFWWSRRVCAKVTTVRSPRSGLSTTRRALAGVHRLRLAVKGRAPWSPGVCALNAALRAPPATGSGPMRPCPTARCDSRCSRSRWCTP